jgi:hypothetical protein
MGGFRNCGVQSFPAVLITIMVCTHMGTYTEPGMFTTSATRLGSMYCSMYTPGPGYTC